MKLSLSDKINILRNNVYKRTVNDNISIEEVMSVADTITICWNCGYEYNGHECCGMYQETTLGEYWRAYERPIQSSSERM